MHSVMIFNAKFQKSEIDSALNCLLEIAKSPRIVKPYINFINGILDYLEALSDSQIRASYSLFSTLSFANMVTFIYKLL